MEKTLTELKAEAYDVLASMEHFRRELTKINQLIIKANEKIEPVEENSKDGEQNCG